MGNRPPAAAGTVRVGLLAAVAWQKGHRDFIRALALLCGERNIRGYIIGGPVYESKGSQEYIAQPCSLVRQVGVQTGLCFTGFLDPPSSALRALHIAVPATTPPGPFPP